MSVLKRQAINDNVYFEVTKDDNNYIETKLYISGYFTANVTDTLIEYDEILNLENINVFWFIDYIHGGQEFRSYYYDNELLYTETDKDTVSIQEKNEFIRVVNKHTKESLVLDCYGNELYRADGEIYYYDRIGESHSDAVIMRYEDNKNIINLKDKDYTLNHGMAVVNKQHELCIVGAKYNKVYDLDMEEVRELSEEEIADYLANVWSYRVDKIYSFS